MTLPNTIALVCLTVWLTFETVWDLRDREIPAWFSLVMLVPGLIWLGLQVSPWAAGLMAISILTTELMPHSRTFGLLGIVVPLVVLIVFSPALWPLVVGWGIVIVLWVAGLLGGADGLAAVSLLIVFPSWGMAAAILAGLLVWNLALLVWKYRQDVGLRLWTVWKTRAPGNRDAAGIGAYALASLFYGIYWLVLR